MSEPGVRRRGRPRDESIDARVLEAAEQLLTEVGYEATTVQAIAERAGVHASAIYRRWPTRTAIIERAVFPGFAALSVQPTGDLSRDVRRFVRAYLAVLTRPAARAAVPGLLSSYQASGRSGAAESWLEVSARSQFVDILRAAPTNELDPAVDPHDVFDLLLGGVMARVLVPTVTARARPAERLVELVLRALRPSAVTAGVV